MERFKIVNKIIDELSQFSIQCVLSLFFFILNNYSKRFLSIQPLKLFPATNIGGMLGLLRSLLGFLHLLSGNDIHIANFIAYENVSDTSWVSVHQMSCYYFSHCIGISKHKITKNIIILPIIIPHCAFFLRCAQWIMFKFL